STLDALGLKVLGLDREQPMTVRLRVRSSNGTATAYLTAVEINGRPIPAVARDKLAQMLAKSSSKVPLGRPIDLPHDVDRVALASDGARARFAGEPAGESAGVSAVTRAAPPSAPPPALRPAPTPAAAAATRNAVGRTAPVQ